MGSDDPASETDRKALSILYANRAQAALKAVRLATSGKRSEDGGLPKEHRPRTMRAAADAAQAVELDPVNAKAWMRKGQALLLMSVMQQRAKEADRCIVEAQRLGLPASLQTEASQWQKQARQIFNQETPMPEQCPQM